jgi:enoyl-CoA hydratase/carnithine racemase
MMLDSDQPTLVKLSVHDNGVGFIELNRPKKRNALSQEMIGELVSILYTSGQDSRVRAVVLAGCPGGPFCGKT